MRKDLQAPRSQPSAGDHTIAITKALVGAIPLIGTAANELIDKTGLVALTFRSLNSFKRPFVRMPRSFFHLATSAAVVDYRTH